MISFDRSIIHVKSDINSRCVSAELSVGARACMPGVWMQCSVNPQVGMMVESYVSYVPTCIFFVVAGDTCIQYAYSICFKCCLLLLRPEARKPIVAI